MHEFEQQASGDKPTRKYLVAVRFSHHCFTEGKKPGDDPLLEFRDASTKRDHRTFDVLRWELSKRLPEIVRGLMERHIAHTNHHSFFTIEVLLGDGARLEYEMFFEVARIKGKLNLIVTTAFVRDQLYLSGRPQGTKIRLSTILFNVSMNKPIRSGR